MQLQHGLRNPRMLLMVNHQDPREQFDFVIKQPQGNRAGKEGRIEENALPERHIEGDLPGGIESERGNQVARGEANFLQEINLYIGDRQLRLVNNKDRYTVQPVGERNLPWPIARLAIANPVIKQDVPNYRQREGQNEMLYCAA
jgi:hypothetical protein